MDKTEQIIIDRMIGVTASLVDRHKCVAAILWAKNRGIEKQAVSYIINARLSWLDWYAMTQRKWQSDTRNPNKARHHDSIELREKYVRCHQ